MTRTFGIAAVRLLVASLAVACTPAAATPPVTAGVIVTPSGTLGPGDVFEVRVYGEPDLSGVYRVGADGSVDLPLGGRVLAQGSSASRLGELVTERLTRYVKDPQVSIFIKEFNSQKIFVFGQVQRPGTFPYEQGMNIVQAITLAGGFAQLADDDGTYVTRLRDGREQRISVSVKGIGEGKNPNFPLEPGDIIYVPESVF